MKKVIGMLIGCYLLVGGTALADINIDNLTMGEMIELKQKLETKMVEQGYDELPIMHSGEYKVGVHIAPGWYDFQWLTALIPDKSIYLYQFYADGSSERFTVHSNTTGSVELVDGSELKVEYGSLLVTPTKMLWNK